MKRISAAMAILAGLTGCHADDPEAVSGDRAELARAPRDLALVPIGRFVHGTFNADGGVAEIVAHAPSTQRLLVVNGQANAIDVLDMSDPAALTRVATLELGRFGGGVQSVATHAGVGAAAVQGFVTTDPGRIVFFDVATGAVLDVVTAGALPDMVAFTGDGRYLLSANEGEPSADYAIDPRGSVTIVDLRNGFPASARHVGFEAFDGAVPAGVRIGKRGAPASTDFEPEYLTISADSRTAWVTLQENNAIAVVDIAGARITRVFGAGTSDHAAVDGGLDASDRDSAIRIARWPVRGLRMPDGIASYRLHRSEFVFGDWGGFIDRNQQADHFFVAKRHHHQSAHIIGLCVGQDEIKGAQKFPILSPRLCGTRLRENSGTSGFNCRHAIC